MAPDGINEQSLVPWLEAEVGLRTPLSFTLVAGGRSNITYFVDDAAGRRVVLRRPPLGMVLASAHDMGREHRIISALGPTEVPVPETLALCHDDEVNGAPFYVMSYVPGHIVRNIAAAESALTVDARRQASLSMIDVLGAIHAVDVDAVGLGELGRKEGYVARQLKRWNGQLEQATSAVPPQLFEVHDALAASIPEQGPPAIVHGDYRLDNCLLADDGNVQAVLDWELCTLGDTMADVGLLMVYWNDPSDDPSLLNASATAVDGFPRKAELLERYAKASGRDVSNVDYYTAFGFWKLACIVEGVYARYQAGVMGTTDPAAFEGFLRRAELVERYGEVTGRDLAHVGFFEAFGEWKLACILQGVLDRYRGGAMADDGTDPEAFAGRVQRLAERAAARVT